MLGTIERLGFEALARSKESASVAFASVAFASAAALGAVAFAYYRSSSSEAEAYERAAGKREAREEMAEAVELRSDVRGDRDATEKYRERWERTFRRPFPYEIDAYGRIRPEGSREEFGYLPDIMPQDLEVILRTRREVPTAMELRAWGTHLARGGQNTLSRAAALSQAIENLRSKGVKDAWLPILWTEGPHGGPNPPKYRSPEHARAYAEIVKSLNDEGYDAMSSASKDVRWNIVKDSETPLQDLEKIEQAIDISMNPDLARDIIYFEKARSEKDRSGFVPRPDLGTEASAKAIRRLLDLGVGPEAILMAAIEGLTDRLSYKELIALSLLVNRNVSKIPDSESRNRVALATIINWVPQETRWDVPGRELFELLGTGGPLIPELPGARSDVASKLVLGMPIAQVFRKIPKKFVLAELSKMDERTGPLGEEEVRDAFVQAECKQARKNVLESLALKPGEISEVSNYLNSVPHEIRSKPAVSEWVASVCNDERRLKAITTLRRFPTPGGVMVTGRYIHHIDQIIDRDIQGPKDSVSNVFKRASDRVAKEIKRKYMQEPDEPLGGIPPWWPVDTIAEIEKGGGKFRQLRTARDLVREGAEMAHCAGMYCPRVAKGDAFLASLTLPTGERVTLDFSPSGALRQNLTYKDKTPSIEALSIGNALEAEVKRRYRDIYEAK